ncbi:MAG: hypothetical protein WAO41_09105 [Candidatus Nanopelagicales bacterium]
MSIPENLTPWSSRAPQKYLLSAVAIVVGLAIAIAAVRYIGDGVGGIVPFLMLLGGPALAVVYVYVFAFKKWNE